MRRLLNGNGERLALLLLFTVLFVVGLGTVSRYGPSWDEPPIYRYGDYSLAAYRAFFHPASLPPFENNLNLYGPAYFMAAALFSRLIAAIYPAWSTVISWHLFYFITFLFGLLLLYVLCRRWLGPLASFGACLLFASQPLLWGHAFINPKDLPFMTFFLATIYLGLEAVDRSSAGWMSYVSMAAASMLLGLTTSIRLAGPLAGAIVAVYAVAKLRWKALLPLLLYAVAALLVFYVTWPNLWGAPFQNLGASLRTMVEFPFLTNVLFQGHYYPSGQLPWFYFLQLLALQLTLPAVLLLVAGLGLALFSLLRRDASSRAILLLFLGWFVLPLIIIVVLHSSLYDNGRQLLFSLPPLFLLMGFALEALFRRMSRLWFKTAILLICVLPGIYGSIRLHPYEYVYYNQLVGGTGGAYRRYEMDYWGLSYHEVALWLNQNAPAHATIWATGPAPLLQLDLRPDLLVSCTSEIDCGQHYDYVVTLVRWKAETRCRRADPVYVVERRGAPLTLVQQLPAGRTCQ